MFYNLGFWACGNLKVAEVEVGVASSAEEFIVVELSIKI